jgi:peptidyl-prolyl cis-trans isomerase SurA
MRRSLVSVLLILATVSLGAQAVIDTSVATVRLTRQEVISQRSLKTDFDRLEAVAGRKLTQDERRQMLDSRINNALFLQYCERERIIAADTEVATYISNAVAQLGAGATQAHLEKVLRSQGIASDVTVWARQQVLLQKYIQTKQADRMKAIVPPTADEIIQAYELNKKEFFVPNLVRVSMIYVDLKDKGPEDRKKALDTLNGLSSQIKASPDKFGEFMTRALGGDVAYKASSQLTLPRTPEAVKAFGQKFIDASFALKVGLVSDPIECAGTSLVGYALARVEENTPEHILGLSDMVPGKNGTVQQLIQYQLSMQKLQTTLAQIENELVTQLRSEATIKILDEKLEF